MATKIAMFLHNYEDDMNCPVSTRLLKEQMDRLRSDYSRVKKLQMEERVMELLIGDLPSSLTYNG